MSLACARLFFYWPSPFSVPKRKTTIWLSILQTTKDVLVVFCGRQETDPKKRQAGKSQVGRASKRGFCICIAYLSVFLYFCGRQEKRSNKLDSPRWVERAKEVTAVFYSPTEQVYFKCSTPNSIEQYKLFFFL